MKNFVVLPSGMVVDVLNIVYFGKVNAIKESPRQRIAKNWSLSIQFEYSNEPTTLLYDCERDARDDYSALVQGCEKINK